MAGRGERGSDVGRAKAADRHSSSDAEKPGDLAIGRGDERAGLGVGEAGSGGSGPVHDRENHPRHRPPPLHHSKSRSGGGSAAGSGFRNGNPRRADGQRGKWGLRQTHSDAGNRS
ncbi:hypothetical protein U1Q18_008320 [Sarracenia purpurea var. burkii]